MVRRLEFVLLLMMLLGAASRSASGEEIDWAAKLRAFAAKIDLPERLGEQTANMRQAMAAAQLRDLTLRLNSFQYEAVTQILNQAADALPPILQRELTALARDYSDDMARRLEQEHTKWKWEVEQLLTDARTVCLSAEKSAQLDGILRRCALLAEKGSKLRNEERNLEKVHKTSRFIGQWMDYLEQKVAGYNEAALQFAHQILENQARAPVFAQDELKRYFAEREGIFSKEEALRMIYEPIQGLEDLRVAADRAKRLLVRPGLTDLAADEKGLRALSDRWEAWRVGGPEVFRKASAADLWPATNDYLRKWDGVLLRTVAAAAVKARTGWTPNDSETEPQFLTRAIDELYGKGDFAGAEELMRFASNALDPRSAAPLDRQPLEKLLAGMRFEAAGDIVAAVDAYRGVLRSMGKYSPQKEASAALGRLRTTNQSLVDAPESLLMEEVRTLAESLKR